MEKWKALLKNKDFLLLIGLLIFALALRLYFYTKTAGQALWWDEADYMSLAKAFAFGTPEIAADWRARGISIIFGVFYWLGGNENFMRIIEIIISVAGVWMTYLLGKEFYNAKVGLVAAFFMSVFWLDLFWTTRFSMGLWGILFWGFAALFFWRGYVKNKSHWYSFAAGALIAYGIFAYESVGFIFPFLGVFILTTDKLSFWKKKHFWYLVAGLAIVLTAVFAYNLANFDVLYPRVSHIIDGSLAEGTELDDKLATQGLSTVVFTSLIWFQKMPDYLLWPMFALFILGLISMMDLFLGFDLVIKNKSPRLKKDYFVTLWILTVLVFFGIYLSITYAYYEPRYVFPLFPALFIVAAKGTLKLGDFIGKHKKELGAIVVIAILLFVAVTQISTANESIIGRSYAYSQEPAAGLWLKDNSQAGDVIMSCTQQVPLLYYSEREVIGVAQDLAVVEATIAEYQPRYFVLDFYASPCPLDYIEAHETELTLSNVFYEGEDPVIVIYEINY